MTSGGRSTVSGGSMVDEGGRGGGSEWLDTLLYDEVHYSGADPDGLCDLIHMEFIRLRVEDLRMSSYL